GVLYGIELDQPKGWTNGTVKQQFYFECEPNRGTFVRSTDISLSLCFNFFVIVSLHKHEHIHIHIHIYIYVYVKSFLKIGLSRLCMLMICHRHSNKQKKANGTNSIVLTGSVTVSSGVVITNVVGDLTRESSKIIYEEEEEITMSGWKDPKKEAQKRTRTRDKSKKEEANATSNGKGTTKTLTNKKKKK
ncbi:hypothetical protein RFI_13800, partial [Reticulomyxa filosa]